MTPSSRTLRPILLAASLSPSIAAAVELVPHRAVYDLSLASDSAAIESADGRIVVEMTRPDCMTYALDYRFVARFVTDGDFVVTDQQTKASEHADGTRFDFETKTFVDGSQTSEAKGVAETGGQTTEIVFTLPKAETISIPSASFPIQHTRTLIEAASRGEYIYQTSVFDGDPEAGKQLSSTAVIATFADAPAGNGGTGGGEGAGAPAGAGAAPGPTASLAALDRWRISEAYYNKDSDADGQPQFETVYTLFENGVSGDLTLAFPDYTLEGQIAELEFLDGPDCPSQGG